ncbi:hypothetical protein [Sinorhizobium meliloti]|uniref:hypothetical protein n=1 Tax=Rhizobium meliloti TaxID=382 RepID=UPI000FD8C94B|nr:hypothetical protein [Sinorhizobium meliloti]RVL61042.1 hypothetical protein CN137_17660 [Sinorhizobium meliloti]
MSVALRHMPRVFTLHIRCDNCLRESSRTVEVPAVDDAPCDVDELMESGFLGALRFNCVCAGVVGQIIGISQERSYGL